ncbi:MAG: hypothetical protein Q7S84_00885 [bacterium]|nr:hypothetical protein [bacterium]
MPFYSDVTGLVINEEKGRPAFPMDYDFAGFASEDDDEEARFASELRYRRNHGGGFIPIEEVALPKSAQWEREEISPMSSKLRALVAEKGKKLAAASRERLQREYRAYAAERDVKKHGLRTGNGNGMPVGVFRSEEEELYYRLRAVGLRK